MFRRLRSDVVGRPDPALMALVESTAADARGAGSFRAAVAVVLDHVATTANWQAGHALVPADLPREWHSSGLWFPDDGIGLGGLRHACANAAPAPLRGHRALALELQATQWSRDIAVLGDAGLTAAAANAGIRAGLACPVVVRGRPVAVLEWFLATPARPAPDVAHVLGHLSGVLSEIAERPVPAAR